MAVKKTEKAPETANETVNEEAVSEDVAEAIEEALDSRKLVEMNDPALSDSEAVQKNLGA